MLANIHNDSDITMLFLTHDLSIIAKIADRVAVMYAGNIVEVGTVEDIFYNPIHPYTSGLIHAIPSLVDDLSARRPIPGSPPNLLDLPDGCRFAPRCGYHLGRLLRRNRAGGPCRSNAGKIFDMFRMGKRWLSKWDL